jgi:hypothetical protein
MIIPGASALAGGQQIFGLYKSVSLPCAGPLHRLGHVPASLSDDFENVKQRAGGLLGWLT